MAKYSNTYIHPIDVFDASNVWYLQVVIENASLIRCCVCNIGIYLRNLLINLKECSQNSTKPVL